MKPSKKRDELFATIDAWIDDRSPSRVLTKLAVPQRFVGDARSRYEGTQVRGLTVADGKARLLAEFCEVSVEIVELR